MPDSRIANNAENIAAYVKSLAAIKPAGKSRERFSVRDHLSQTEKPSPAVSTSLTSRKRPSPSPTAIPKTLKCFCPDSRVNDIFDELRKLRLDRNPNASGVLLRLLLEFSVSHYLDSTGLIKPLLEHFRKKDNKGPPSVPTSLRQV